MSNTPVPLLVFGFRQRNFAARDFVTRLQVLASGPSGTRGGRVLQCAIMIMATLRGFRRLVLKLHGPRRSRSTRLAFATG